MSEATYTNHEEIMKTQCVVDCVVFFYKKGKGGENYRSKSTFRCHVNREEKTEKTTFDYVYLRLPTFDYVYLRLPTFDYVYLRLPTFHYVYLRSTTFTYV